MSDLEKRGIYNVTFNEKNSTPIYKDVEAIQDAIIEYIAMYVRGWHNIKKDKGSGAEHIKLHLEKGSNGEITIEELVNIGNSLRTYLKQFNEPLKDNESAKVYEWQNDDEIRFRVITDKTRGEGHSNTPLSPSNERIITFYSDRNLSQRMEFKNPKVKEYYKNLEQIKSMQGAVKKASQSLNLSKNTKNKDIER